jgi:NADPH:quinone reductase
MEASGAA